MGPGTCSPCASAHVTIRTWALGALCGILMSTAAGGCVLGHDTERPVLAVDPLWDVTPGGRFLGDTCKSAGVGFMTWEIQDSKGRTLEKSDDLEPCMPLSFVGLTPGTYRVVLTGYTLDEEKRWEGTCSKLELGRFDTYYQCPVHQQADDDEASMDAGVPADAGDSDAN